MEDLGNGQMLQEVIYNPDSLFEANRQKRNLFNRSVKLREFHLVAELPPEIYWDLWRKGIVQDRDAFRKWLDDSDNENFRTNNIRLGKRSQ